MNSSSSVGRGAGAPAARAMLVLLLTCTASGCYLWQAAGGQMAVMSARRPISAVIANPDTPPALRDQLTSVSRIRDFASNRLGLPDNGSYRQFADIHRPYVVWNVVAAPEFSVRPLQWCFPIAGCVSYRGYFKEAGARDFAASLKSRGNDVMIGGVAAYSTLGHFDDPILSSMLGWSDVQLAGIVFHELTHQLLYVQGDSDFNEALATVVEHEGVRRWLKASSRERDLENYDRDEMRYAQVVELLSRSRAQLAILYGSDLAPVRMREKKAAEIAHLRDAYSALKADWGPHPPFENWFAQSLNNAHIASVATYQRCVPGLMRELRAVSGDLPAFYARARALAMLPLQQRQAQICEPA